VLTVLRRIVKRESVAMLITSNVAGDLDRIAHRLATLESGKWIGAAFETIDRVSQNSSSHPS
jgi:ABC-type glutathione transport system ATPase component